VFSGVWVLNVKASDDPKPAFVSLLESAGAGEPEEQSPGRPGGRGGRGGRGGPGGSGSGDDERARGSPSWRGVGAPGGRSGGGSAGGDRGGDMGGDDESSVGTTFGKSQQQDPAQRRAEIAARMTEAWQRLLITHSGADLEVVDARDQTRSYVLDGKWHDRRVGRGASHQNARWDGDTIVVALQQQGRPGMTETYRLASEEKRLYVTLRLEPTGAGAVRVVRLVYEAPQ
jgi:hypothetical protein